MMRVPTFESCETFTQAEFAEWIAARAGDDNHYELLNGRIVMNPPAGWPHGEGEADVLAPIQQLVRRRELGRVFGPSQGFELPSGDTVAPDVAFVSTERWRAIAPEVGKFLRLVPDLAVEVLSPGTASRDRREKKAIYEKNGVREYWLVDLHARQIVRFDLRGERYDEGTVFDAGAILTSGVLAELRVPVADLLPRP
jgi:Uma2 family endonuclease